MNLLEAKFILESCRFDDLDPQDPRIVEALRMMESDPELARWFAATQELDRVVVSKLREVPVPEDLQERIRAGGSTVAPPAPRWNRRRVLAMAAGLATLAVPTALFLTRSRTGDLGEFRTAMVEFLDHEWDHSLDMGGIGLAELQEWLASQRDPVRVDLPAGLESASTLGCKRLGWRGNRVTLVCLLPQSVGAVVHVLVVDRACVKGAPSEDPVVAGLPRWTSAAWSRGDKVYLALTQAAPDKLLGLLQPNKA